MITVRFAVADDDQALADMAAAVVAENVSVRQIEQGLVAFAVEPGDFTRYEVVVGWLQDHAAGGGDAPWFVSVAPGGAYRVNATVDNMPHWGYLASKLDLRGPLACRAVPAVVNAIIVRIGETWGWT